MGNKSSSELKKALAKAKEEVEVGGQYVHFKSPDKTYTVLNIAFLEETEETCVIYRANYKEGLIWIRTVENWLEMKETNNGLVQRFRLKQ